MADIKFYRGSKPADITTLDSSAIYFFTDSKEICMGGNIYGASVATINAIEADIAALESVDGQHQSAISALESWKAEISATVAENTSAAAAAQSAADKAQGEVDALETYVGTIPSNYTQTNIVDYINKVAEETITAANGGSSESAASVLAALNQYKVENDARVDTNAQGITEAKEAAGLAQDAADAAQADIDAFLAAAEVGDAAIDTLKEIQDYITSDGEAAAQMTAKIDANAKAIAAIEADYLKAADKTDLQDAINTKADTSVVTALEARVDGIDEEIDALDAAIKTAAGEAQGAQAEVDALEKVVENLTTVVDGKAAASDLNAVSDRVTANESKIETLEDLAHSHTNKSVLDGITGENVASWSAAEQNAKNYADSLLVWNAL